MAEVRRIERKYSRYDPSSWLSCLNAAAGVEAVPCDAETRALLDYADCVVHVFHPTLRQFYQLERLWGDATPVTLDAEPSPVPQGAR